MALRVILHAPTAGALERARPNARNLQKEHPDAQIEIVANAGAAPGAVILSDPDTDPLVIVCTNSLHKQGLQAAPGQRQVASAIAHIAQRQLEGWQYVRA